MIVSPNNRLSAAHWARLLDGLLLARSPRLDWPTLRRRTHNIDVLDCPGRSGHLRLLDVVSDPSEAQAFLAAAGLQESTPIPTPCPRPDRLNTRRDPAERPAGSA